MDAGEEETGRRIPENGWTRFHCGDTLTDYEDALPHFGPDQGATPACNLGEEGLAQLRAAERRVMELQWVVDRIADLAADHAYGPAGGKRGSQGPPAPAQRCERRKPAGKGGKATMQEPGRKPDFLGDKELDKMQSQFRQDMAQAGAGRETTPGERDEFDRDLEDARAEAEPDPIDAAAVELALSGRTEYFITTRLFWDCECREDRIRPGSDAACAACGALRAEQPDSRINEVQKLRPGPGIDWTSPGVIETMDEYNAAARRRETERERLGE